MRCCSITNYAACHLLHSYIGVALIAILASCTLLTNKVFHILLGWCRTFMMTVRVGQASKSCIFCKTVTYAMYW